MNVLGKVVVGGYINEELKEVGPINIKFYIAKSIPLTLIMMG